MMPTSATSLSFATNSDSSLSPLNLVYLYDLIPPFSKNSETLNLDTILLDSSNQLNKYSIYCPNPKCCCLILRSSQVSSSLLSKEMYFPPLPNSILPSSTLLSSESTFWFRIPDKMTFENIGFSNPTQNVEMIRYLSCADCDIGPLGFVKNATCFLDAKRLRYRKPSI